MADYKEMYLTLMRAVERANRILVNAQQKCEEQYLASEEPRLFIIPEASEEPGEAVLKK